MRLVRLSSAVLAFAFALLVLACNSTEKMADNSSRTTTSPQTAQGPQVPTVNADGVRRITTVEAQDLLAKNQAVIFDVRTQAAYDQGHVRGAKLIPYAEVANRLDEFPRNKTIITYCT
ncbi:MAG TPA: rhodanese-like domain-containing protein [Pyrinomonadaceae bacterium]